MKKWNTPSIEELDLNATAYSPAGGNRLDGAYKSTDGKYNIPTYGASSGDNGEVRMNGNDPTITDHGARTDFITVGPKH